MPLQNDLYLQDGFEATQFWQKSPTVLAWVEQSFSMHPSLQWVKQWPLGYDYWDIHDIHEERQRDVEMLLSYVFFNGWKLEMVVRDCLGVLHTLCPSWRWWRRENERERERSTRNMFQWNYWSTWIPWQFLLEAGSSWPPTSRNPFGSAPLRIGACRLMDQHPHQIASCMRTALDWYVMWRIFVLRSFRSSWNIRN